MSWQESSCCQEQATRTINGFLLRTAVDHMVLFTAPFVSVALFNFIYAGLFMFTPIMEFRFAQRINIYRPDKKQFISFMKASEDKCLLTLQKQRVCEIYDFYIRAVAFVLFCFSCLFTADVRAFVRLSGDRPNCCQTFFNATLLSSDHASLQFKWNVASSFISNWTRSILHYAQMQPETGANQ